MGKETKWSKFIFQKEVHGGSKGEDQYTKRVKMLETGNNQFFCELKLIQRKNNQTH